MAYQSLYRRYRPRRFSEIRGQSHVVTALRNAVRNNSVSHAYLFSGPRGTGKTSTARILAKALNCENLQDGEPCCECGSCVDMEAGRSFDLFELDAASNNGVDAIRDLVDRAAVGSPGRTKVYILDEVHMLSTAASNALLKTLEEPPGHVRFVLATTDPQKVLPTIKSRTQHYEFQLLGASELEEYVRWIIADADLTVDDEAIRWAVRQGKGSARDTLSALDQVVAAGGVVERVEPVDALIVAVADADPGAAIQAVADALNLGHDPRVLGRALLDSLRDLFLLSLDAPVPHLVPDDVARLGEWANRLGTPMLTRSMDVIGSSLVEMRNAADPRIPLEVALIKLTRADADSLDGLIARIEKLEAALAAGGEAVRSTGGGTSAGAAGRSARGDRTADGGGAAGPRSDRTAATTPAEPRTPKAPLSDPPVPPSTGTGSRRTPSDAASDRVSTDVGHRRAAVDPDPASATVSSSAPAASASDVPPSADDASVVADARSAATTPDTPTYAAADPAATRGPDAAGAASAGPDSSASISVESLNSVLMDKVVPSMKGVAKAIYSQGRFIAVDGDVGIYLVENAPTKDRAEKAREQVEQLLSGHVGTAVTIRVVDSPDQASQRGGSGGAGRSGAASNQPTARTGRQPNDNGGPGSHRPPGAPTSTAVNDEPPSDTPEETEEWSERPPEDDGRVHHASSPAPSSAPSPPPAPSRPPSLAPTQSPGSARSAPSVPLTRSATSVPQPPPVPSATPTTPEGSQGSERSGDSTSSVPSDSSPAATDEDMSSDDEMYMDVSELEDATDVATTGLERLLEAFPGATVIEQDTEVL